VSSNAVSAWAAGSTGQGIKIGIVDSGINPNLVEFTGRIDSASGDVAGSRGLGDDDGHGTAVAATAAAARNGLDNMGVAYNATIVMERADQVGSCATKGGCSFYDDAISAGIDAAHAAGARVINMSLGGDPPGQNVLDAIGRAVADGVVFVISAGNDGQKAIGVNADAFGLTAAQTYPGKVILAGALDQSLTSLADFSNKAGTGQAYYLSALGDMVRTIDNTGTGYYYSGTSFSAPIITGAVALMAQAFPTLSGQQIIQILLDSADDLGAAGDDATFGQGRLNISRAFQPIGTTSLAGSATPVDLGQSVGSLPAAAGDAATAAGHKLGAVILDSYSRAFTVDFATRLRAAQARQPLSAALAGNVRSTGAAAGPVAVRLSMTDA